MKNIGFLFPGQGAQTVGMGQELYRKSLEARKVYEEADGTLGFPLSKLCFEGPEAELTRTVNAQIAIFVTSIAVLAAIRTLYPELRPDLACGLSLGEFTALVALEAVSFEEGLRLVRRRGELMEEANQKNPGTMASILGLSAQDCALVCRETGAELANMNSPEQIVISGGREVVKKACEVAKQKGAKRAIPLKVGGAFHSSLMTHARSGLEQALAQTKIKTPKGTFIPNVTGEPAREPETIRHLLSQQLTSPVEWVKSMETVVRLGVTELFEIGPGQVLKGLAQKINSKLHVTCVEKPSELEELKPIFSDSQ